ncbi:ubiquitin-conjugating enzyme [Colletotrichum plurivorum]|uniref:Ubiquitin-conjugating enzyme n=1 Tax=Colletotrichum plurivorum TaxID=2175906 RepID=A0A8H6NIX3_9PEZI|nr:ubiquitin-conjugating enzyme [Colletotrichum plurivorum]
MGQTLKDKLSKKYHEQRKLVKNGTFQTADEPDEMEDHLIRDLSSSSTPAEEEEAIIHYMNRIMSNTCPGCNTRPMGGDSSSVFKHAERIIARKKGSSSLLDVFVSYFASLFRRISHVFYLSDMSRNRIRAPSAMTEDASHVECPNPKCHVESFCPCCSQVFPRNRSASKAGSSKIGWCCYGGRIFYNFALLCGPNAHPDDPVASLYQDQQVVGKNAAANASVEKRSGSGSSGTGYSTSNDAQHEQTEVSPEMQEAQVDSGKSSMLTIFVPPGSWLPWDRRRRKSVSYGNKPAESIDSLVSVLEALIEAWPQRRRDSQFDSSPPRLLLAIAHRSPLMIKLAELLADSITEVQKQLPLYERAMDFLEVLADHPPSAPLVKNRRIHYPLKKTILPLVFGDAEVEKPDHKNKGKAKARMPQPEAEPAAYDECQSLVDLASNLAKQAHRTVQFYKRARSQKSGDDKEIIAMCERICRFAEKSQAPPEDGPGGSGPSRAPSNARPKPSPPQDRKEEIKQWLAENNVAPIEGAGWRSNYVYAAELEKSASASVAMRRMHHFGCQLAMLEASLPEGIYVRYDEVRPDAMKVLIVGPKDTPYENGVFEFDVFCPAEYPAVPPEMTCKTVVPVPINGDRRRFNPNLYEDGSICLSLLDTWDGQQWNKNKSTLLQLFVSIQSMIFCPEPYENEPIWHGKAGTPDAENYKAWVRRDTVATAMTAWLVRNRSPEEGYVWGDVVGRHFELKAERIVGTVDEWKAMCNMDENDLRTLAANLEHFS